MSCQPAGTLYASEHGNNANDEINRIESGQNYGWPVIQGFEEKEGTAVPQFTSGDGETWAASGMNESNEKLYVAALRGSAVLEFDLATGEQREIVTDFGRIRMCGLRTTIFISSAIIQMDAARHRKMTISFIEFRYRKGKLQSSLRG